MQSRVGATNNGKGDTALSPFPNDYGLCPGSGIAHDTPDCLFCEFTANLEDFSVIYGAYRIPPHNRIAPRNWLDDWS